MMNNIKNQKGVTMISLVITIIVLVILSTMITHTGISSIRNSRFERFKRELEIVQSNVDSWYEKYIDLTFDEISIGTKIPSEKEEEIKTQLNKMVTLKIDDKSNKTLDISTILNRYRYFGKYEFESLQIDGVENDYIIDVKKRVAIVIGGYEYDEKTYYMLDQVRDVVRGGEEVKEAKSVTSITLDVYNIEMMAGNIKTIVVSINPSDATEDLIWMSSNEDIVSIQEISGEQNNMVTFKALKSGRTSITVINRRGTTSASCEIIVKEANVPKLSNGMIPIKYNVNTKKWVICSKNDLDWYNYTPEDKQWANVMLCDGTYDASAPIGTEVAEKDLGSMFVWIPRFAYKITEGYHTATNGKLSVVFLEGTSDNYHYTDSNGNVKQGKATRNRDSVLDEKNKCYTEYVVHPCFTNGSGNYDNGEWKSELTGIWVSKFQAGIYTTDDDIKAKKTISNNSTANNLYYPIFKGKKYTYNNVYASQCYDLSLAVSDTNNPYGLSAYSNSHLLKSSEWGAVTYLSISEYGYSNGVAAPSTVKIGNSFNYNGSKQNIRNQAVYGVTGYTGMSYTWNEVENGKNTGNGTLSSTTGNIYGAYDYAGLTADFTASYIKGGNLVSGTSFATNTSTYLATAYPTDSANKGRYDFNNNYSAFKKIWGDGIYELSYGYTGATTITGWFGANLEAGQDNGTAESFFPRGNGTLLGLYDTGGAASGIIGFHTALAVE